MYIAVALLLLTLTAGMFLLAKSKKDNLGLFYKITSWLVIVLSTLCLICCLFRCTMGECRKGYGKAQCHEKMMMSSCNNDGCDEMMNCKMHKKCKTKRKNSCKKECKADQKEEIIKDTVIVK